MRINFFMDDTDEAEFVSYVASAGARFLPECWATFPW